MSPTWVVEGATDVPNLEEAFGELERTSRSAMLRRRLARPESEAWRQADEFVHEVSALMGELARLIDRQQGTRVLQPVRVRTRTR
ncbi:MAG: hypothetical protein M0Z49_16695 [Chloroflexi bacterium]|nr:hypothetical protein [Chloroflexota bacterium]